MKKLKYLSYLCLSFLAIFSYAHLSYAANNALEFNGSTNYVDIPNSAALYPTDLTIEFWAKRPTGGGSSIVLSDNDKFAIYYSGGNWRLYLVGVFDIAGAVSDDNWHHIVGIFDTTGSMAYLYIDGVLANSNAYTGPITSSNDWTIAAAAVGGSNSDVTIDEVRISDSVRYTTTFVPEHSFPLSDTNTVAYYNMNEGSGTTLDDVSGNGNDGTLVNSPTWVTGLPTYGLEFDGSTNYVEMSPSSGLALSDSLPFTVEAWIYNPSSGLPNQDFGIVGDGPDGSNGWLLWGQYYGSTDVRLAFSSSGGAHTIVADASSWAFDQWNHVAAVGDGAGGLELFLNGTSVAIGSVTSMSDSATLPLYIGRFRDFDTYALFYGTIDEVRISDSIRYTTTFTPSASFALDANTIGYWKMEEGTGTTAFDSSGNAHDGTLIDGGSGYPTFVGGVVAPAGGVTTAPTVTTSAASSVATSTVTFTGNITATGGADATESGFAYGTSATLQTTIATTTLGAQTGTATFTSDISSLTPDTTYYVRAYAVNSAGTSFGAIQTFTTSAITVPTLTTEAASSLTATGATLNGIITSVGNEGTTQSGFAYGTSATLQTTLATSTLGAEQGTASFSEALSSLTCNTTYYFRPYATNTADTGFGTIVSFTTSACVPTVTTSAASSVATSTVTFTGNITATGGADATESGFAYGTSATLQTTIATTTLGAQTGTATFTSDISSLTPDTTYYVRAYAVNSAGTSFGAIQTFTTSAVTAPTVTTDSTSSITTTTATLNGTISSLGGNTVTEHGFAYGVDSTLYTVIATTTLGAEPSAVSFTSDITSLTCGTTYYNRAYATNSAGDGLGTISAPFTTSACTTTQSAGLSSFVSTGGNLPHPIPPMVCQTGDLFNTGTGAPCPSTTPPPVVPPPFLFLKDLKKGDTNSDVKELQIYLNTHGFLVALTGPGSLGQETNFFGSLSLNAVKSFQLAYADQILTPVHLTKPTGYVGPSTRAYINSQR